MVGDATVGPPGGDAAVLRVPGSRIGLAMTIDGNGRYCRLDPETGARIAVAEAARNLVAVGARPLAVTDCLNFGNPDRPEVYWQLRQAVEGIAAACRALGLPVVSGNVSLYNESEVGGAIDPTPIIGMVGLLADHGRRLSPGLVADGDFVLLVGRSGDDLGGSEYQHVVHGQVAGPPPDIDLERERRTHELVLDAAASGLLRSAHDVAEGGLLVALAECCLLGGRGVRCGPLRPDDGVRLDAALFGESQSRFVVSAASRSMAALQELARVHDVELALLGLAGGDAITFEGQLRVPLSELREAWEGALLAPAAPPGGTGG
jgi:phosphoribosylformylglycinamidine synthase